MKKFTVILVYVVLALGTLLVFWQVRNFDFVNYDDADYVTENPQVLNGLTAEGVVWAFKSGHAANWHPVTWLSLMLDCQLFGKNPGMIHFTNLLLHIINTLLLFGVLKKMTGSLWPSAFVAAAFAIHPMHVESVAWISERKDVLSTLFFLLTLWAYVSYVKDRSVGKYLLTLLLFILGLLTKPMLVTLPFLLLLLDYWPLDRFKTQTARTIFRDRIMVEKIPFFVLASGLSVVTFLVQRASGAVIDINKFALNIRVGNAFLSYIKYIGKMFWPTNLTVFYFFDTRIQLWQVVVCALMLIGISILVILVGRNRRYLPVGWFWFLGTLVPVIGLIQVGEQSMAERYSYISYTGLFVMIAWGMGELVCNRPYRKIVLSAAAAIVLLAMGIATYRQAGYWKNSLTFFTHAVEVEQNNCIAHNNLGEVYNNLGRYQEAIESCKEAIRIKPDYAEAHNNLGNIYDELGRYQEATDAYKQAIRIKPDNAEVYKNLGAAYSGLGLYQDAIEACKQAIKIKADYADAYYNLGVAYGNLGRHQDAMESFKHAVRIKPDYSEAYYNLGVAYGGLGRWQEAIEAENEAIKIKPDYAEAYYNLSKAYNNFGRYQESIEACKQAIRIKPDYAEAYNNLSVAYGGLGRWQEAIESFEQAIRIKPDYADAHYNLGVIYCLITKDKDLALEEYKILKNLNPEQAGKLSGLVDANVPANLK